MKRVIFIYNPKSGDHMIKNKLDRVIYILQENNYLVNPIRLMKNGLDVKVVLEKNRYDLAIIAGGDGTINSVVNLFLNLDLNIPFGIIPTGTGNDFANNLDIPKSIDSAMDIILKGWLKEVDVGLIDNEKYFLDTFAAGLFAGASFNTSKKLKQTFGSLAYYFNAISEMINPKPFNIKIDVDGEIIEERAFLLLIVNGKNVGGLSGIINTADLSDGMMDIFILKNCFHIEFTKLFIKLLNNTIIDDKNIHLVRGKKCEILNVDESLNMTLDGERLNKLPKKIEFINKKISIYTKNKD